MATIAYGPVTHIQVCKAVWSFPPSNEHLWIWRKFAYSDILETLSESVHLFISVFLEILDYRESTYTIAQLKFWMFTVVGKIISFADLVEVIFFFFCHLLDYDIAHTT